MRFYTPLATAFALASVIACNSNEFSTTKGVVNIHDSFHASKSLKVCWQNKSPKTAHCTESLQNKLIAEFDEKTQLELSFYDECSDMDPDITIWWQDTEHHASAVVRDGKLQQYDINLICDDYRNADAPPLRDQCRSAEEARLCNLNVGTHEFGHAIGLSHEDMRPGSCNPGPYEGDEFTVLTAYDDKSVMNFCYYQNIVGSEEISLTKFDIIAINKLFSGDLTFSQMDCGEGYIWVPEKSMCLIKPTQSDD